MQDITGLAWWEYREFYGSRFATPMSIAFAFKASHNHFVLDRGGKVFKRTAPVIKLHMGAREDDYLALLGALNSSGACFWLREKAQHQGGGAAEHPWSWTYEFATGIVERLPLPADLPADRGRHIDHLARQLVAATPQGAASDPPTPDCLAAAHAEWLHLRAQLISAQEELDWDVYRRYGLLSDSEAAEVVGDGSAEPLHLGERSFEIVLARQVASGQTETQWFARHNSNPVTELPAH